MFAFSLRYSASICVTELCKDIKLNMPNPSTEDYYEILGIDRNASESDIKKA